ncbi:hypothetical protein ABZ345_21615 [Lentzea sp. NPDC005914]|uniref:hypothetical protein n=1 Tax=Lentzea sp. NPDC005914 TaxID=3154572 RepID=UPI00340EC18A
MKRILATVVAVGAAFAFAHAASAQEHKGFELDKTVYLMGRPIALSYDSADKCEGKATSNGFLYGVSDEYQLDPPNTMRARATASFIPGSYTAEMVCDGKKVSRAFVVQETPDTFSLDKTEVEAGGEIVVTKSETSKCGDVASSVGFTTDITLQGTQRIGRGKVVDTPGTYQASMFCGDTLEFKQFVVKAKAPVAEKPKPKAPIVKPKGAPQTGGGGTAR